MAICWAENVQVDIARNQPPLLLADSQTAGT